LVSSPNPKPIQVNFQTIGCRVNEAESHQWASVFASCGFIVSPKPINCDILILNSCAVTVAACKKSRQIISSLHQNNPSAKIILTGCFATIESDFITDNIKISLCIPNQHKHNLPSIVIDKLNLEPQKTTFDYNLLSFKRQRAFLKVQDGCRYQCSYCIITKLRGGEKSVDIRHIIQQIKKLELQQIQEVILTGIHLGGYGSDINLSLTQLIKEILSKTKIQRIRLGSLEPWELSADFIRLFKNPRLMPHLHLPVQSGSDRVLKLMNRRGKTSDYLNTFKKLKNTDKNFNITTDIIVGHPGESDDGFMATYNFCKKAQFGNLHIFKYSPRENTKAALMSEQIDEKTKKQRYQKLDLLNQNLIQNFIKNNKYIKHKVLWENKNKQGIYEGYTQNYQKVFNNSQKNLTNTITEIKI